jgi:hypothetical protein
MSAVQSRIHYAMKQEFRLLKGIIRDYTPTDYSYQPTEGTPAVKQSDYDTVEVIPVSDPNAATMSQKVVQYQAVMQMAQANPQIYDLVELNRQMLDILGIKNAEKLVPSDKEIKVADPVTENMNILNMKPVKAFSYQDHQAHITTHMSFRDDPKIRQMIGQNPQAGAMLAAVEAHIAEHLAFEYKNQMEEQLGVDLPTVDDENEIPQEYEKEISKLTSEAAKKLLQKDVAEAQMQQQAQQAQDPMLAMQQKELQLKELEIQAKNQKTIADIELDKARLELEKMRIDSNEKIKGAELGARAAMEKDKLDAEELRQGARLGMEAVMNEKKLDTELAKTAINKRKES